MAFIPSQDAAALIERNKQRQAFVTARRGLAQLLTVATDVKALRQRFSVWPEEKLCEADLAYLVQPEGLNQSAESAQKLQSVGLLRQSSSGLQVTVPVYEQARSLWAEQVEQLGKEAASRLGPFLDQLRQEWQAAEGLPDWEQVAHNLVVGFLLGAYAGQALLRLYRAQTAVIVVIDSSRMPGNWFTFTRMRPDLALVDLVGSAYPDSGLLCRLLQAKEITQTLASADEQGRLIIYGDRALQLLRQLSAYRQTSPGPWLPNDYWLKWPILTPQILNEVKGSLDLTCRAVKLILQELKTLVDQSKVCTGLRPEDLAFVALLDLVGGLRAALVTHGILPPVAVPWLKDWQSRDGNINMQSEMLRGLGR